MTPQRKRHLYDQYVLAIINDGDWHRKTIQFIPLQARQFAGETFKWTEKLARHLGDGPLNYEDRAYVYFECWKHYGGDRASFMRNQYDGIAEAMNRQSVDALPAPQPASQPEPQEDQPVNNTTPAFETKHFVFGMDVANMTPGQLLEAIKKIENEIAEMKLVKSKSEFIKRRIAELEGMLAKVVEVLDAK